MSQALWEAWAPRVSQKVCDRAFTIIDRERLSQPWVRSNNTQPFTN